MKRTLKASYGIALGALAVVLLCTAPASANRLIPFQGRVTDGAGQPLNGVFRVTFSIYDVPTGGTALYVESHTDVSVIGGQINVLLGSLVSLDDPNGDQNPADAVQFDSTLRPRFLGIKVGADTNQEMVPRHELVPSFHARIADTTVKGGVGTDQLTDGAVTLPKIDTSVLETIIPPGSIVPYGGTTAPAGWVLCDGSQYEGADPQFAKLFAAIGTSFGGSGTSFNVPDLRGQFLRGRDAGAGVDPDAGTRTGGDAVGSRQGYATIGLSGTGSGTTNSAGQHRHDLSLAPILTNSGTVASALAELFPTALLFSTGTMSEAGLHAHTVNVNVNVAPPAGQSSTEVRPKNVAVNYICKL